ncbi:hypothetical protein EVG20_g7393 [Dentipellis fragilis]|uniref:F-box domain-containing protein n=1 Tax=Dentipellis fragilis TaxID=205917 RepID=A0A4Y9YD97_9AGAM|nr:hypothetical protein EVG20_g7393 [Dentipellis fragilis]
MLKGTVPSLPAELQVKIFECLDVIDLLNCSVACKFFHDIIRDRTALQYRIQLAIDGVSETEDARPWSYSDGVLCYVSDNSLLHYVVTVVQLPSLSGGGSSYDIELADLSSIPVALTHDATQDMLALVTRMAMGHSNYLVAIETRSLRTGEYHPTTGLSPLSFYYLAFVSHKNDTRRPFSEINIWRWRLRASLIGDPDTHPAADFAFLTPNILLLAQPKYSGYIEVLTPRHTLQVLPDLDIQHLHSFVHLLSLQLPDRSPYFYLNTMTISCEPTPGSLDQHPFSGAEVNGGVISVACTVLDYRHGSRIVNFVFHARTIFDLLVAYNRLPPSIPVPTETITIPWIDWGPDACRAFMIDPWKEDICAVYGNCVVLGCRDTAEDPIRPRPPRDRPPAEAVTAPTFLHEEPGFQDPVETTLPYVAIDIPNADNREAYCDYLLDGQRLLAMKPRADHEGAEQEVDVFVF